jgi:hypothetical protein
MIFGTHCHRYNFNKKFKYFTKHFPKLFAEYYCDFKTNYSRDNNSDACQDPTRTDRECHDDINSGNMRCLLFAMSELRWLRKKILKEIFIIKTACFIMTLGHFRAGQ